jgi:hypothetical protein
VRTTTQERYAEEYTRYSPYARRLCQFVVVFCALLLLDVSCTTSITDHIQQLDGYTTTQPSNSRDFAWHDVATEHTTFRYLNQFGDSLFVGKGLLLRRTPFFGVVRSVSNPTNLLAPSLFEPATIYSSFLFIPLLLAGLASIGALTKTSDRNRVSAAICVAFLFPICLFMLLFH